MLFINHNVGVVCYLSENILGHPWIGGKDWNKETRLQKFFVCTSVEDLKFKDHLTPDVTQNQNKYTKIYRSSHLITRYI